MGGLSSSVLHLAICLSKHYPKSKHQILVQQEFNDEGIETDYLIPSNLTIKRVSKFGIKLFPISLNMQNKINKFNPDLIYIKGIWKQTSLAGYLWKRKNPKKILIVSPAGMLQPINLVKRRILKKLAIFFIEKPLLELSDAVHAVSEIEKSDLFSLNFNLKKLFYIGEGVPILKERMFEKNTNFTKEVVFISRVVPTKGVDILIESLKEVNFNGWKCCIYGPCEADYLLKIKTLINDYNLASNVIIKKGVFGEEKEKTLKNASAFILPSFSEAFGIAIAEAMAYQLPIITTTCTPWEIIKNKNAGWYVNPTKEDLAKAIQELFFKTKEELEDMGSNGRKVIINKFDWNETAKAIKKQIDIFKKV